MGEPIRIMGGDDNEQIQAQVHREAKGVHFVPAPVNASNKTYEGTLTAGVSPLTCDFETDADRTSVSGYLINDGNSSDVTTGACTVDISRDGINYDESFTIDPEEIVYLDNLKISKIRLTHGGTDTNYRINLI